MLLVFLQLIFFFLATVLAVLYFQYRKSKSYWMKRKIPFKEPQFLVGNFKEAGTKNLGVIFRELYEEAKKEKVFGVWQFTVPVLLVINLNLVKRILVSDFSHFDDHGVYFDEKTDPLSANLLTIGGCEWRKLRTQLNRAFTVGKMKMLFPMILRCGEQLKQVLKSPAENEEIVEFKDLLARFTTDVISSCAFGIETNSLRNKDAIFRTMGKEVFQSSWEVLWRNFVGFLFPNFAKFFRIRIYSKKLTDFFVGVIRETMHYREVNKVKRNDILQMLIQLKNEGFISSLESAKGREPEAEMEKRRKFTDEQAAAQAFIFFTAGFETSSTTMQYALYELAMNETIQNKLRSEIQQVLSRYGGKLSFEIIYEMTYLGQVVDETLRKYPPATNLSRICTQQYEIPDSGVVLEKGTQVSVSIYGIHMDERYYPKPEVFDPERFTEKQKASRPNYTYMPFGEGPRTCIGQRFGLTQIKVGLINILANYKVTICKKHTRVPPVYDPKSFFCAPKGGMFLRISLFERDQQKN